MHFYASESTMDNLKSVFNVFWGKPSLGGPACSAPRSKKGGPAFVNGKNSNFNCFTFKSNQKYC